MIGNKFLYDLGGTAVVALVASLAFALVALQSIRLLATAL